jgi:hypothetical protein
MGSTDCFVNNVFSYHLGPLNRNGMKLAKAAA